MSLLHTGCLTLQVSALHLFIHMLHASCPPRNYTQRLVPVYFFPELKLQRLTQCFEDGITSNDWKAKGDETQSSHLTRFYHFNCNLVLFKNIYFFTSWLFLFYFIIIISLVQSQGTIKIFSCSATSCPWSTLILGNKTNKLLPIIMHIIFICI